MTTTEKTSIVNLVYFNHRIVSIKNVVKKAKINESQKIIRKIKLLNNKKGNEAQLEKNKRKAENLKQEMNEIKKLKFNEVAICSFENEDTTFSQYLSKNKNLSLSDISLARISLSKVIVEEINKIKVDPKIDGWKTIFIQYKARCEKRKSWKDKLSKVKEIESKLNIGKNSDKESEIESADENDCDNESDKESVEQEASNSKNGEDKRKCDEADDGLEKNSKKTKKEIVSNTKNKKSETKQSKIDSVESENSEKIDDLQDNSEMELDDEISLAESDDDAPLDLDNYELGGFSDEEEQDLSPVDLLNLKPENESTVSEENQLKPIVFENKQNSRMFIKQFNLDELKDLSEIPTKPSIKTEEKSESENETDSESSAKVKYRIDQDPFFLDQNGNEIENSAYEFEHEKFRNRRQDRENEYEQQSYSSYDRYQSMKDSYMDKRQGINSSFKSSLSSNNNSYDKGSNNFSANRGRPRDNSRFNNQTYNKNNNYEKHNNSSYHQREQKSYDYKPKQTSAIETQKLHPSWQAKKQMEDRAKLKFSGKKMVFDD